MAALKVRLSTHHKAMNRQRRWNAGVIVVACATAAALSSCGDGQVEATDAPAASGTPVPISLHCSLDKHEKRFLADGSAGGFADGEPFEGMPVDEARRRAEAQGLKFRVVGEDGRCFDRSLDQDGQRVNVYVEDATVVRAVGF